MKLFSFKSDNSLVKTVLQIIYFSKIFSSFKNTYFRTPYDPINLYRAALAIFLQLFVPFGSTNRCNTPSYGLSLSYRNLTTSNYDLNFTEVLLVQVFKEYLIFISILRILLLLSWRLLIWLSNH